MCTVVGMFCPTGVVGMDVERVNARLGMILALGAERGKTSWGSVGVRGRGVYHCVKEPGNAAADGGSRGKNLILPGTVGVIGNNRAAPVTEVLASGPDDIQPFTDHSQRWWISHNGVIANDAALRAEFKWAPSTQIDSGVLPFLFGKADHDLEALAALLRDHVKGSFAIAAIDAWNPQYMYLATNWRPLYMTVDEAAGVMYFASLPQYMETDLSVAGKLRAGPVVEVPPYTLLRVSGKGGGFNVEEVSLYAPLTRAKRVLAVCSGGMDSVVTAASYVRRGREVTLLHYQYNCRAQAREEVAVRMVAEDLGCNLIVVPTTIFSDVIRGNTLTDPNGRIIMEAGGRVAAKDAKEWVPARNTIMTMLAVGIAEARDMDVVALGLNLEEAGSYPDNEQVLFDKLGKALPNVVGAGKRVEISAPCASLMKPDIVRMGMDLGAPLEYTWSCYNGNENPCGACGSCYHRMQAFKAVGIVDPRFIFMKDDPFWSGCVPYERKRWE